MATAIEHDARNNFNRQGLPKGYDPIAPEHILGYAAPPIRVRPAGSLSEPGTFVPLLAYIAAFAALAHYALKGMSPEAPRANPPVEPGTWAMHLQQHIADLIERIGIRTAKTRFRHDGDRLLVSNLADGAVLSWRKASERLIREDALRYGYTARAISVDKNNWMLEIRHPVLDGGIRENPTAFTQKQAQRAGKTLHVNYERLQITPRILRVGMNIEREHSNVTHGSPTKSAKIAMAHLEEKPDYYARLKKAGL